MPLYRNYLNSPVITGTPTAPTPATGTNTTQIATTAYVIKEIETLNPSIYTYCGGL